MKNIIKNLIDGILMFIVLMISSIICIYGITSLMIPISILSLPFMFVSADRLKSDIDGNYINNSIFSVSRNGKITQDSLRNPLYLFKIISKKDKYNTLLNEEFKMLKQLKKYNKKGNLITYHTISQSLTIKLLKYLKKENVIDNLSFEKEKKSRLFFEKLLIGNNKKSNNKYQMYNIKFTMTGKAIDSKIIDSFINPTKEIIITDSSNKEKEQIVNKDIISRKEQIEKLKKIRNTFIQDENENKIERNFK